MRANIIYESYDKRKCLHCLSIYRPVVSYQKYCPECKYKRLIKPPLPDKCCNKCGIQFQPKYSHQKLCSDKCRKENKIPRLGRVIGTGNLGAAIECIVSADLLLKGWNVFRSISPNCFCDLVAIRDDVIMMIEVRSAGYGTNGSLCFSKHVHSERVTHFAVCVPGESVVHIIPIDKAPGIA